MKNPFEDIYLSDYIMSFLSKCHNCNKFDTRYTKDYCVICKCFYCINCKHNFKTIYGFYENCYCITCKEVLFLPWESS